VSIIEIFLLPFPLLLVAGASNCAVGLWPNIIRISPKLSVASLCIFFFSIIYFTLVYLIFQNNTEALHTASTIFTPVVGMSFLTTFVFFFMTVVNRLVGSRS